MVKCRNGHTRILEGVRYRICVNLTSFQKQFSAKSILTVLEKIQHVPRVLPWAIRAEDKP